MDPFSITVGIVGLVDGGLSLSKELKDKVDSFRDAGSEIVELAHEVDLCTTLIDVLGNGFDRPESNYPANVIKQTKWLVKDMRNVFSDIRSLIADYDYSNQASAKYVVKAEELKLHHSKLKSLQLSFVFMLSVCPPQKNAVTQSTAISSSVGPINPLGQAGSFEGTLQHISVPGSAPTSYTATLTLHPASTATAGLATNIQPNKETTETKPELTEKLEDARKNHELKKKLKNLSRSPFFSKEAFRDMFVAPVMKTQAVTYEMTEPILAPGEENGEQFAVGDAGATTYADFVEVPVEPQYSIPSDEQADREVDDILEYLFNDEKILNDETTAADQTEPSGQTATTYLDVHRHTSIEEVSGPSRYSTPLTSIDNDDPNTNR